MMVRHLKKEIFKVLGVPVAEQALVVDGNNNSNNISTVLADTRELNKDTLPHGSTVSLRVLSENITLRIRVGSTKKVIRLSSSLSATILQIKHETSQSLNIPLSKLVLCLVMPLATLSGPLVDRLSLLHYNILDNAQIVAFDHVPVMAAGTAGLSSQNAVNMSVTPFHLTTTNNQQHLSNVAASGIAKNNRTLAPRAPSTPSLTH
eukprot:PhM_4_TR16782/c1_g3_i4/m.103579